MKDAIEFGWEMLKLTAFAAALGFLLLHPGLLIAAIAVALVWTLTQQE